MISTATGVHCAPVRLESSFRTTFGSPLQASTVKSPIGSAGRGFAVYAGVLTATAVRRISKNDNHIGPGLLYHYLINPGPPYYGEDKQSSEYQDRGWDYDN